VDGSQLLLTNLFVSLADWSALRNNERIGLIPLTIVLACKTALVTACHRISTAATIPP
jgi:hypothetical protein